MSIASLILLPVKLAVTAAGIILRVGFGLLGLLLHPGSWLILAVVAFFIWWT